MKKGVPTYAASCFVAVVRVAERCQLSSGQMIDSNDLFLLVPVFSETHKTGS